MYQGKEYLKSKLNTVKDWVKTRYDYYEMKNMNNLLSISVPQNLMNAYRSRLGWCAKAVDLLGDRLVVNRFKNDYFNIENIYKDNNSDILFGSAIKVR